MTAVRGKSRQENWRRPDEIAVIVLELDLAADPVMRRRVEHHFDAAFKLCRALQHDARSLCTAYLAARHERKTAGPKAVRVRLGLDRNGIEARAGLPPRQIQVPRGAMHASKAGQPLQSYRRDTLARGYRAVRADHAAAASAAARRKDASARQAALAIVAAHGSHMITEDVDIRLWALRWGRGIAAFTPGRLLAALERECQASGGYLARASTRRTALSQHCLCGARAKKNLSQRQHACACGAEGDRDLVSALLAACVTRTDTRDPKTARLDPALREHARTLVTAGLIKDVPVTGEEAAQQEGLPVRSTIRHNPGTGTGEDGSHPAVAPAGQGERPAQPRNRNHGRPWGQRRNRRTSRTPSDPQAASRLMDQLLGTEAFVRGDHDGEAAVRAAVEHLVHRVGDRHAGVRVGYHQ